VRELPTEVVLTNINAPVGQPERLRIAFTDIADVFKGTDVEAPLSSVNGSVNKGCSVLVQMTGVGSDGTALYPYSAHLVLKVPYGPAPTAANVITMLQRLLGSLYATSATSPSTRLDSLIRGALAPVEL